MATDGGPLIAFRGSVPRADPALAATRQALHIAIAAGDTAEVDRLSSLCFALIRQAR